MLIFSLFSVLVDQCLCTYLFIYEFVSFSFFVQGNCSGCILEIEVVSMFVFENLDLVPGEQSSVIAVKDLNTEDKVKLVARLVRQSRGPSFVPKYKYALDSGNQTVYVLVADAEDAESMTGRLFRVDG